MHQRSFGDVLEFYFDQIFLGDSLSALALDSFFRAFLYCLLSSYEGSRGKHGLSKSAGLPSRKISQCFLIGQSSSLFLCIPAWPGYHCRVTLLFLPRLLDLPNRLSHTILELMVQDLKARIAACQPHKIPI